MPEFQQIKRTAWCWKGLEFSVFSFQFSVFSFQGWGLGVFPASEPAHVNWAQNGILLLSSVRR